MNTALLVVAVLSLLTWLAIAGDAARGEKYVKYVDQVNLPDAARRAALPRVSVIVPARNEERNIGEAMQSLLHLDYPDIEIVAVNDRSGDRTGAILDELAAADPRLRVEHVTEIPAAWLGKNHALQRGATCATGEIILFTDADVVFEPTVLTRAVVCMLDGDLDHLTIAADVHAPRLPVELFVAAFMVSFVGYFRPWRMADPHSSHTVGIGAFNLVRTGAYREAGGHAPIAMRPDDDLSLARLLRDHGARQAFGVAGGMVSVEWYPSLAEAIRGLEKNSLAAVGYRPWVLLLGAPVQLLSMCWPFVAIFVTAGATRWLNLALVFLLLTLQLVLLHGGSVRKRVAALLPAGVVLLVYAYLRAVVLTYGRGGIRWRGTFYSLKELRRAEPPQESDVTDKIRKTDEEWRAQLTDEQYRVTREAATEAPFTGEYEDQNGAGVYRCVCCGAELFLSGAKFHSGSGWPSFTMPASGEAVEENSDVSYGTSRTEVVCRKCDAHLGHVFPDGPAPTGLRYCINSASLEFEEADGDS